MQFPMIPPETDICAQNDLDLDVSKWLLPLSSSALTIPEPTVPAPPRANTTLSEFAMLDAAARTCWRMEDDTLEIKLRTFAEHLWGPRMF